MRDLLLKIADRVRMPYHPSPLRRDEVVRFLSQRPSLSHDEWHRRFGAARGVPLDFVDWFRNMCSKNFEFDLSAALPDDRLFEDLGLHDATWGDVGLDIVEDFEERFSVKLPVEVSPRITTFGQLMEFLWTYAQEQTKSV
jgi:hypothetical protein